LPGRSSILADAADGDQQETTSSRQFRFISHCALHLQFASSNEGGDGLGVACGRGNSKTSCTKQQPQDDKHNQACLTIAP